jgi:SAM-dependent methyltransferase
VPEELFDLSEQYDEMLRMGVSLSGEDPAFFMRGRIEDLASRLPDGWKPRRILDFGCGTGESSAYLAQRFPGSFVVGVDTAAPAIDSATRRHGSNEISFGPMERIEQEPAFDLCYVNGVFHHIEPPRRLEAVQRIFSAISPAGYFALFENNPGNPGTRMVMKRIPFDRDAKTLSYLETQTLVKAGGFRLAATARFLFYFPRSLAKLRPLESALHSVPLGAQFYVLGAKPDQPPKAG